MQDVLMSARAEAEHVNTSLMGDKFPDNGSSSGCINLTVEGSNIEKSESESTVAVT